jgi:hypothetical protein
MMREGRGEDFDENRFHHADLLEGILAASPFSGRP